MKFSSIITKTLTVGIALFSSSFASANDRDNDRDSGGSNDLGLDVLEEQEGETIYPSFMPSTSLAPSRDDRDGRDPAVSGDPHFRTWSGESYDFHGVCDLVLLKNTHFGEGLGMDIHVRTMVMFKMYSYVDSASVRIGNDTLEVKGGEKDIIWMNGEQVVDIDDNEDAIVLSSKFPVSIKKLSERSTEVRINLGGNEEIVIKTWGKMVRVSVSHASSENFGTSVGMMGAYSTGAKLGRDGITKIEDSNIFGQEWQVLPTEAKLFHEIGDTVQSPVSCEIPSSHEMRRRLLEATVTLEEAKMACDHWGVAPAEFDLCTFDIMATNDVDSAGAY
jgi:hypothetical protein